MCTYLVDKLECIEKCHLFGPFDEEDEGSKRGENIEGDKEHTGSKSEDKHVEKIWSINNWYGWIKGIWTSRSLTWFASAFRKFASEIDQNKLTFTKDHIQNFYMSVRLMSV